MPRNAFPVFLLSAILVFAVLGCGDASDDSDTAPDGNGDDDFPADDTNVRPGEGDDDDDDDMVPPAVDCEEGMEYEGTPPEIVRGPFLQQVGTDTIVFRWDTDRPAGSVVKYGREQVGEASACDFAPKTHHEMRVYGLEASSIYSYVVRSDGAQSDQYGFGTAALPGEPFTFAVWGDSRSRPEEHRRVAMAIYEAGPDFAINVGDIVASGGNFWEYDPQFFDPAFELMANTPTYVSIGNHEAESPHYYDLLSLPGNEMWYAVPYGDALFISLNTNRLYIQGSEQYQWLEATLAQAREDGVEWIVCFAHHPPWSEGWDSPGYAGETLMRLSVAPLMERYGVDAFFVGHTHDYERGIRPGGMLFVISGGGGASLDSFQQDFDWITVYESTLHYVWAEVAGNTLYMEARAVDGTVLDQLQLEH